MPTYDYLCRKCGYEAEYPNVSSDSNPVCAGCGNKDQMHRLPSRINLGPSLGRKVTAEDFTGEKTGIMLGFGQAKCKEGHVHPALTIRHFKYNPGPSLN